MKYTDIHLGGAIDGILSYAEIWRRKNSPPYQFSIPSEDEVMG